MTSMYVCHSRTVSPSSNTNCSRGVPTTGELGTDAFLKQKELGTDARRSFLKQKRSKRERERLWIAHVLWGAMPFAERSIQHTCVMCALRFLALTNP